MFAINPIIMLSFGIIQLWNTDIMRNLETQITNNAQKLQTVSSARNDAFEHFQILHVFPDQLR